MQIYQFKILGTSQNSNLNEQEISQVRIIEQCKNLIT